MTPSSPLADAGDGEADDLAIVRRIQGGDRDALEALVVRHQDWIYNIVLRMVYDPHDAEDVTQEVLITLLTKLSTFEGRSRFRTWLYRIAVNHVLNMKRARAEAGEWTFQKYGDGLDNAPDAELPDPRAIPVDLQLLVDESRITCSSGMLLCLSREQRLVYILGEIFGVSDGVGAELLDSSRDNFRQKLSRARRDLHNFMHGKCGLVNKANPCRCARKTQVFMEIMAPDVTYFDPIQERRVDGLPAMTDLLVPLTGRIQVDRYDMVAPLVQRHGDAAILTFNLVSYRRRPDGTEHAISRWNSTEIYARVDDGWRIVHSHWSFVKPELAQPMSEEA